MQNGYIKLHRQIQENEYYFQEPFDRIKAWIDLLLLANHKTQTIRIRGIPITIERGQLAYSIQSLAKRWQRDRKTVMVYLEDFKAQNMLDTKKTNVTTLITIRNYEAYQGRLDTKLDTKTDTNLDTNKNDKKVKKKKTLEYSDPFKAFWGGYPRRIGKGNAWQAWQKIGVDNGMFGVIMEGVEKFKESQKGKDMQYIPHPTTWLNGRRWEDEVEIVGQKPNQINMVDTIMEGMDEDT